jgi:predicted protein tyrosine phosphatase
VKIPDFRAKSMVRKILFVCGANIDRSPTAEKLFNNVVEGLEVKSAGTFESAVNPLTEELIEWADEIYVMQMIHRYAIRKMMPSALRKVRVLGIQDVYCQDSPDLKREIIKKMKRYIDLESC